jgi:hypothetical protein
MRYDDHKEASMFLDNKSPNFNLTDENMGIFQDKIKTKELLNQAKKITIKYDVCVKYEDGNNEDRKYDKFTWEVYQ